MAKTNMKTTSENTLFAAQPRLCNFLSVMTARDPQNVLGMLKRVLGMLLVTGLCCSSAFGAAEDIQLNYASDWLGNTFAGGDNRHDFDHTHWVALQIEDICLIDGDSKIAANGTWDEGGFAFGSYPADGSEPIRSATPMSGASSVCHSAGQGYWFVVNDRKLEDGEWYMGVTRMNYDGTRAPFDGGETGGNAQGAFMKLFHRDSHPNPRRSCFIAADSPGNTLFVYDPVDNVIKRYYVTSMAFKGESSLPNPDPVFEMYCEEAVDKLWIAQESADGAHTVTRRHFSGAYAGKMITDVEEVADISMDSGGRLMIADSGPYREHVRYYDVSGTPYLDDTFGAPVLTGSHPGKNVDGRFYNITGAAEDDSGNLYVADSKRAGHTKLWKFNSSGAKDWVLESLQFMDAVDIDPLNEKMAYSKHSIFEVDHGQRITEGYPHQGWTHVASTLDWINYPDDPRIINPSNSGVQTFTAEGQLFMMHYGTSGNSLVIYRYDGYVAVPAVWFGYLVKEGKLPPNCPYPDDAWLWVDDNGDGQYTSKEFEKIKDGKFGNLCGSNLDSSNNIWSCPHHSDIIHEFIFDGVNAHGVPVYGTSTSLYNTYSRPSPFNKILGLDYDAEKDQMYISGCTPDHPSLAWNSGFRVVGRYSDWKGTPQLEWTLYPPYRFDGYGRHHRYKPVEMKICNDYMFLGYDLHSDDTGRKGMLLVYDRWTKEDLGRMHHHNHPLMGNRNGCLDMANRVNVRQLNNGEIVAFVEEDEFAKQVIYRWRPGDDTFIEAEDGTVSMEAEHTPMSASGAGAFGGILLTYTVAPRSRVSLDVYSLAGRRVARLVDGERQAGTHSLRIERDDGTKLHAGTYVVRLKAGNAVVTKRILRVR